jgi:hypothetical protein
MDKKCRDGDCKEKVYDWQITPAAKRFFFWFAILLGVLWLCVLVVLAPFNQPGPLIILEAFLALELYALWGMVFEFYCLFTGRQ